VGGYFVANLFQPRYRELFRLALDFLHRQNINLRALKELNYALSSSSCRVDVPGCNLHF
jgi:hypothetical protein